MSSRIQGISSMATRAVLAQLLSDYHALSGVVAQIEAVGGVDAAKRVQAGEAFDVVVLASDAIERLLAAGHLRAGSRVDLVHSGVAMAVPAGAAQPDVSSEEAVRQAVLAARTIGYSTGPSGVQLVKLFERWGMTDTLKARTVQAPPGVPVAALVAQGEVALGFQQLSEMLNVPGIQLLGPLPAAIQINTTFSAAIGQGCIQVPSVQALLKYLSSPDAAPAKLAQGMTPA
jgi:molybdate transport system substrate-binding protein